MTIALRLEHHSKHVHFVRVAGDPYVPTSQRIGGNPPMSARAALAHVFALLIGGALFLALLSAAAHFVFGGSW